METLQSRYYNLDKHGPKWDRDEFARVVLYLESLNRTELLSLMKKFNISFTEPESYESANEEQIIAILIDDVSKKELLGEIEL